MEDFLGYFFIFMLILIAAPLVFWIVSLLYTWVLWLLQGKKKLNESYSEFYEIDNPICGMYPFKYKLGLHSNVKIAILDIKFNELKIIFNENTSSGIHKFELNTEELKNGKYFIQIKTTNQTLTKEILIDN